MKKIPTEKKSKSTAVKKITLKHKKTRKSKEEENLAKNKKKILCVWNETNLLSENSDEAKELYNGRRFGSILKESMIQLSFIEGFYLLEKNRIKVVDGRNREITSEMFLKKAKKKEPNFWTRYCVFKDMRDRGYIVKTALKFGADFRVYDRGIKPGEDHAKWILYPVQETTSTTWFDFSAKMRVAHSTKKRLLIGVVDDENDVTYYEIRWLKP